MDEKSLRAAVIKLAQENPSLRADLLPILKLASKTPEELLEPLDDSASFGGFITGDGRYPGLLEYVYGWKPAEVKAVYDYLDDNGSSKAKNLKSVLEKCRNQYKKLTSLEQEIWQQIEENIALD